jgi:urease accessory protein
VPVNHLVPLIRQAQPLLRPLRPETETTDPAGAKAAAARLRLYQLVSPALPVGAFSYAEGLEVLAQSSRLADAGAVQAWLEAELRRGAVRLEAAALPGLTLLLRQWQQLAEAEKLAMAEKLAAAEQFADVGQLADAGQFAVAEHGNIAGPPVNVAHGSIIEPSPNAGGHMADAGNKADAEHSVDASHKTIASYKTIDELKYIAEVEPVAAPFAAAPTGAAAAREALLDRDGWLLAQREASELRAQQRQMGGSLLQLLADLGWPLPLATPLAWPAAFAWAGLCLQIEPAELVEAYLYGWVANQLSAALRLVPLGPTQAQRLQLRLAPLLAEQAVQLQASEPERLWSGGVGAGLAQLSQVELYSRLFRS